MMNSLYLSEAVPTCYNNDNDAYLPERWAQEGLAILEENMVAASLVHRDFEDDVAGFGDVLNTRPPASFKIRRKTDDDDVEPQDARSTNVQVPLDQHIYNSFVIKDGEASKSFQELVAIYLLPAMQVIARSVDRAVLGQVHKFLAGPAGRVGRLLNLDETNSKDYLLEARKVLNDNKAPVTGATGSQEVSITGYTASPGEFAVVGGNDQPTYLTAATTGGGNTTAVTLHEPNKYATAAGATITVYAGHRVDGDYAASYTKGITIDGFTQPLQIGQLVAFGTGASRHTYTVIESEASGSSRVIWLDRPLEAALADNDWAFTDEPGNSVTRTLSFDCDDDEDDEKDDKKDIDRPLSWDPNGIIGPAGFGAENHIVATDVMPYTIRFENDAQQATAPAAMVTITQTLDPELDWTTFRLGDMGFGDMIIDVPADTAFFQARYDATDTLGVQVDVDAGIDAATGEVRWEFFAIDPATGDLPDDPFVGFFASECERPRRRGLGHLHDPSETDRGDQRSHRRRSIDRVRCQRPDHDPADLQYDRRGQADQSGGSAAGDRGRVRL